MNLSPFQKFLDRFRSLCLPYRHSTPMAREYVNPASADEGFTVHVSVRALVRGAGERCNTATEGSANVERKPNRRRLRQITRGETS